MRGRGLRVYRAAWALATIALLVACGTATPRATVAPAATAVPAGRGGRRATNGAPGTGGAANGIGQGGIVGVVALIDGPILYVRRDDATVANVTTTGDTAVRLTVAGTLGDLRVGDVVAVQGDQTGDAAYQATMLTVQETGPGGGATGTPRVPFLRGTPPAGAVRGGFGQQAVAGTPGRGGPGGIFGAVTSIANGQLTLQGAAGSITVATTSSTAVRLQRAGTPSDVKVNDRVVVVGDPTGGDNYTARSIIDQGP